jgi:hypothetical protein
VIFAREKAVEKDAVADMRKVIGDHLRGDRLRERPGGHRFGSRSPLPLGHR